VGLATGVGSGYGRCGSAVGRPDAVEVEFSYLMDFEFDPTTSAANLEKHGIEFLHAQARCQR
jgi:hypothetical protein